MTATEYVIKFKDYEATDPRLGRHVRHDSRSLQYQVEALPRRDIQSVKHTSNIPVLDQGNLGSCTGNAATKALSYTPFWENAGETVLSTSDADADEQYAVGVYSAATALDPYSGQYPPDDTGSDGLSVAKVLKQRGLISGYQHATSLDAVLTALQSGVVITGTEWRNDMFQPDRDGRLRITGSVAGGHEYVLDEVDIVNKRIWMQNSWSASWGVNGRAYFTFDDYESLLSDDGDATVFVPVAAPAPTPTPTPTPTPPLAVDSIFAAAAHKYLGHCPLFHRKFQRALKAWLAAKNL